MEEQIKLGQEPPSQPISVQIRLKGRKYHHLCYGELEHDFRDIADKVNQIEESRVQLIFNSLWYQIKLDASNMKIMSDMQLNLRVLKDEMNFLDQIVERVAREFAKFPNVGQVFLLRIIERDDSLEYVFGFNFMKNP